MAAVAEGGQQQDGAAGEDGAGGGVAKKAEFVHPRDRFGKVLPKRFTTERVSECSRVWT